MSIRRWACMALMPLALTLPNGDARAANAEPFAPIQSASLIGLELAAWVRSSGDNAGLPFAVVDKTAAEVLVFDPKAHLLGATPALLGSATGDESAPGIGQRELSNILPGERTTPAGRFMAAFGHAAGGRKEFWVDYASAIALHPVVTSNPREARLKRLKSASTDDNRITFGCINVDRGFFDTTVRPVFSGTRGVVYILPESRPLAEVFPAFAASLQVAARTGDVLNTAGAAADGSPQGAAEAERPTT
jgi:hypothetical protein